MRWIETTVACLHSRMYCVCSFNYQGDVAGKRTRARDGYLMAADFANLDGLDAPQGPG